jgi:hypothetical protein
MQIFLEKRIVWSSKACFTFLVDPKNIQPNLTILNDSGGQLEPIS